MQGISLVFSNAPDLIMKTTNLFPKYIIKKYIEVNKSSVEILNNTTLGIHRNQEMQKK